MLAELYGASRSIRSDVQFKRPFAIRLSADGTFALMSDCMNDRVRLIDVASWRLITIAGSVSGDRDDVVGTNAMLDSPGGLGIASDGSFALLADSANYKLRRITLEEGYAVSTVAGSGIKGDGGALDDGIGVTA